MLPQKPFYLIRHGESEANAAELTAGGGLDSPLTELGQQQPKDLAPHLPLLENAPEVIYHSPMIRAKDTASHLNSHIELEMHEVEELREHHFGEMEGLPWTECLPYLEAKQPPPGGETHQQFAQRIQYTISNIVNKEDRLPMIVAHGGLFHAIGSLYEYAGLRSHNCHLHYFVPEPRFDEFPWRVWMFDLEEGEQQEDCQDTRLVKRPAPFCLSHALSDVA